MAWIKQCATCNKDMEVMRSITAPESVTYSDQVRGIIRCQVCNAEMDIVSKRRHTKTCSAKCRKALSRKQT